MRQRNISIDILKCIAAILITNSHMGPLYGKYSILATGGAIGDVLFFFCSGFTLFLGRMGRFDNWYKRRIHRIYPTVFAWAIVGAFIFNYHNDMRYTVINGGGWFVTCIMIYYVILYFIQRYMLNKLKLAFAIAAGICIIWYIVIDRPIGYNMYGYTYFKWCHYFLFMLMGAMMGISRKERTYSLKWDGLKLAGSIAIYYIYLFIGRKIAIVDELQILSLIPLLMTTFYFYKICNSNALKYCYEHKIAGWWIKFIGGLCLEIYLIQESLFTDKMNSIFPLNLIIMFGIILIGAYLLRCCARIFSQTIKDGEYNWKEITKTL